VGMPETWTTVQIEREAEAYQDQFREGEPGFGVVSDFNWAFHPAVPLAQVEATPESWRAWWVTEKSYDSDLEYPCCADIEQWYRDLEHADPRDPVILVQGTDYILHLWDGNHRVGAAHTLEYTTVPAFLGTRRSWTSEQIERIAKFHQEFLEPGEPGHGVAADFNWSYDPAFQIGKLGPKDFWENWWSCEKAAGYGDEPRRCAEIEAWYRQRGQADPLHPIVLVQESASEFYIWDGYHRVGATHALEYATIPAFIGRRRPSN